ncbi:MAG: sporulation transcription factor Spo0A [Lachnospiraceae bacterium]|nr:sporulation transcription factor Spo0A [Lachnospiraceae bacterium]
MNEEKNQQIKILVAQSDQELIEELKTNGKKKMEEVFHQEVLIASVKDGHELIEVNRSFGPDIILMDIVLPKLDGIGVLEQWNKKKEISQKVMVFSAVTTKSMIESVFHLGVGYYLIKPAKYEIVWKRMIQIIERNRARKEEENNNFRHYQLEQKVTEMILEIGIPAHIKGYQYIREGIMMAVKDENMLNYITKLLYPTIAKKYKTTSSSVERAIRHAIDVAFHRGKMEMLETMFGYSIHCGKGKPTNSEFIALLADRIRLEKKNAS